MHTNAHTHTYTQVLLHPALTKYLYVQSSKQQHGDREPVLVKAVAQEWQRIQRTRPVVHPGIVT